jgi:hypothetical protein
MKVRAKAWTGGHAARLELGDLATLHDLKRAASSQLWAGEPNDVAASIDVSLNKKVREAA